MLPGAFARSAPLLLVVSMHKITNVSVLSNIVRLGITDRTHAFSTLRRWRRVQNVTKRVLVAVMFFFTLADTGSDTKLPLITIPAQ